MWIEQHASRTQVSAFSAGLPQAVGEVRYLDRRATSEEMPVTSPRCS